MKRKNRKLKQLKEFAKNYQVPHIKNGSRSNLLENKEGIKLVTENACIRPDIFLDNGRYCDGCLYWKDCICEIKRVSKGYKT